jgi:hypothetical protein
MTRKLSFVSTMLGALAFAGAGMATDLHAQRGGGGGVGRPSNPGPANPGGRGGGNPNAGGGNPIAGGGASNAG